MAKLTETHPTVRTFSLEVSANELQMIERGLRLDNTNGSENITLHDTVTQFMSDNDVDYLNLPNTIPNNG